MQKDKILKKIGIGNTQLTSIKEAVANAEKKTNGEIAIALIPQSDSYSFVELFFAICLAAVSFFLLSIFSNKIWSILERTFWYPAPQTLNFFIIVLVMITVMAFFLLLNIPALDRFIIPNGLKEKRVYSRAIRHFVECGIYKTAERTGILLFVSMLERKVYVIADCGIAEKVEQKEWDTVCKIMTDGLKEKRAGEAFISAVRYCGKILENYFPKTAGNPNEFPNGLVVLEE